MLRAVIYCRCSTEEEAQKDALAHQVEEAKACVKQKEWFLVDEYVESRSGTSTKGRTEYSRLCDDLEKDSFDIIVIKSQDRLMRNTMDWYLFVNCLNTNNKKLYMYLEHKFYTADDSLITGIKAILAEDYSRELSKKMNNAHRRRQESGGALMLTSNTYGLRKLPDGSMELIPEEAAVKKRMYELCAAGYGGKTIAELLLKEGILNRRGNPFTGSDVIRMIRNPINRGAALMNQKHYDFDTKRTIRNPAEEQFIYENKVPAIVSPKLWEAANSEIDRRAGAGKRNDSYKKYTGYLKYPLSGKIFCGICNSPYYRTARRKYMDRTKVCEWKCSTYIQIGRNSGNPHTKGYVRKIELENMEGCDNVHVNEDALFELLKQIFSETCQPDKEKILRKMVVLLRQVLEEKEIRPEIDREKRKQEQIKKQMGLLMDKLLSGVLSDEVYQAKQKELEHSMDTVKRKICQLEGKNVSETGLEDRIRQIEQVLRKEALFEQASAAGMMDEIEKIIIYPAYMEIVFHVTGLPDINHNLLQDTEKRALRFDYGNKFNYLAQKKEEREEIVGIMREDPQVTAKMIAGQLGISLSGVNYRINLLKKEGRIRFHGRGGKGKWEIL